MSKPLSDVAARVAWMEKNGIDRQVVGGWVDMFGYELPAAEGTAWAELINAHLAAAAKAEPRFVPLATVPLQDGAAAAAVLRSAVSAGFPGVMIGTLPRGVGSVLDAPDLEPFWQAARRDRRRGPHPSLVRCRRRARQRLRSRQCGRPHHRRHGGREPPDRGRPRRALRQRQDSSCRWARPACPSLLGRLARNHAITTGLGDPAEALRHIYVDTILHDPRVLRFVVDMIGADRVMLGSDMPFPIGDMEPVKIVRAVGLSPAEEAKITGGLARQLFRL